jgi:flagellar basal body rod protein FlgC
MVDLTASVWSYQANLAVIDAVRQMINTTIDVAR